MRHVMLNVSLTGPYDYFHEGWWIRFGDYGFVQPIALLLASIVSTVVTLPFDNLRTRIMNSHKEPERNRLNYTGIIDAFVKGAKVEQNFRSHWAGFYTYLAATYIYAYLTVGITREFTESWKRKEGLLDWQI